MFVIGAGVPATAPVDGRPTLWIIGDSTVRNGTRGERGWGEVVGNYFDQGKIKVINRAIGGRSSRTFINEGRWDAVLAEARAGDFVLMQFGHNDSGPLDDAARARGSLRGIGDETREIENPLTKKHEVVHTYGWYMRKYVQDARARGMTAIICSPVPHCPHTVVHAGDGEAAKSGYIGWSEEVATAEKTPFVPLNRLILDRYVDRDPATIKADWFTSADDTHTSPAGAAINAECVAAGIRSLVGCKLSTFLAAVPATQPAVR